MKDTREEVHWDELIGLLVCFTIVTAWLTWPLFSRLAIGLNASADPLLNIWTLGWNFYILPRDPMSLFDANIFFPRPDTLAYSEHLFGIAILTWPVYLLSNNLVLSYNLALAASFVLSGTGMYLLVYQLTGNRWAALASGLAFLALPFRFLHLLHIQLVTFQWFPFSFYCLVRFLQYGRKRQLLGVVVFSLLQILSCNYYAVYLVTAMVLFTLVLVVVGRGLVSVPKLIQLTGGVAIVAALSIPFFLPYQRNRTEQGFYRRYEDVVHFSASPLDYLRPSAFNKAPHFAWLPRQEQSEKALFPGFVLLTLGMIGVIIGYQSTVKSSIGRVFYWFCLSLAGVAFILSLGPQLGWRGYTLDLPYLSLYRHVPGFNSMRAPARLAVLVLFAWTTLSGWTIHLLVKHGNRYRHFMGSAIIFLLLFEYQTYSLERIFPPAPEIPVVHQWLSEQDMNAAFLVLPIHEGQAIVEESRNMFYSTLHFKPLVNGFSGWWPNDYWETVGRLRHFPTSRILEFLERSSPVRFVIIHYDAISQPRRRHLEEAMHRYKKRMPARFRFGNDVIYEILDQSSVTNRPNISQ